GLGIAGDNLERDLVAVLNLAAEHGADARLVAAWQQNSAYRRDWVLRLLHRKWLLSRSETRLAIWGLAYKAETHSIKNSPSLALIQALKGVRVLAYDPAVKLDAGQYRHVGACGSALEAVGNADALVIMTPWKQFRNAPLAEVKKAMRGDLLLDPYGLLDRESCCGLGFEYHRLGS
ncbi:MAG: GDP-mannose dehydrogenase, partial [Acidobacteria bacterium]|nr:GDP-mannose dehydrogenase [Acidobacteriota bacterium]